MTRHYPEKQKDLLEPYLPDFPEDRLPEECRDLWVRTWEYGAGVYLKSSYEAVVDYCRIQNQADIVYKDLLEYGAVGMGSLGQEVIGPHFKAYKELQSLLTTARATLGLTPRDAAVLGLATVQLKAGASKLEQYKNEHNK